MIDVRIVVSFPLRCHRSRACPPAELRLYNRGGVEERAFFVYDTPEDMPVARGWNAAASSKPLDGDSEGIVRGDKSQGRQPLLEHCFNHYVPLLHFRCFPQSAGEPDTLPA